MNTKAFTYTVPKETKVYLNFDGSYKIVNREDIHTNEIMRIILEGLLSGVKAGRKLINRNRMITRESAVIRFLEFEGEISCNGFTQGQCIAGIVKLMEGLKNEEGLEIK